MRASSAMLFVMLVSPSFAFGKGNELSFQFRGIDAGAGGRALYGIRYRLERWEASILYMDSFRAGMAYQIRFFEDSWFVPHLAFGLVYPIILAPGAGLTMTAFKLFGASFALRLDNYVWVLPGRRYAWAVIPNIMLGVSFIF